jgi:hypothetical protein
MIQTRSLRLDETEMAARIFRVIFGLLDPKSKPNDPRSVPQYPSLDFIFDEVSRQVDRQFAQIDFLNTKAGILLGFSGVILTLILASAGTLVSTGTNPAWTWNWVTFPSIIGATVCAILAMIAALMAYGVRKFRWDPQPRNLAEQYLHKSSETTKLQLLSNKIQTLEENDHIVSKMAHQVSISQGILLVDGILVALAIISVLFS